MSVFPTDEQVAEAARALDEWNMEWPEVPRFVMYDTSRDDPDANGYEEICRRVLLSVAPFVQSLQARLDAQSQHVWVPVREMPGHVIRQIP